MKRAFFAVGVLASLVLAPRAAQGNGRFPESNHLFFAPNDDQELLLRTTFGMLFSRDRGVTWHWVCENAFPLSGSEDPMFAVTPNSNILATTFQGMSLSKTRACNWEYLKTPPLSNPDPNSGMDRGRVFIDLTTNPNDAKNVIVFASTYEKQDEDGGLYFSSQLFETTDEGATFAKLGNDLDPSFLGHTLDLTKSDPQRLYVTAVRNPGSMPNAYLLVSKDHGQTYSETSIPLEEPERAAYIAAVDPNNADHLYVRTSAGTDKASRLLFSDNAGQSWRVVIKGNGPLVGFALSPDGSKVFVGGPRDGIQVASTTDYAFKQTSTIEIQCLAFAADGLWACSNEKSGFVIGLSKDEGATFEKKTHFCDIKGALECPAGTSTNTECSGRWPTQYALLGCESDDAGVDSAGALDGSIPVSSSLVVPGGGCDCRTPSTSNVSPLAEVASALLAVVCLARLGRERSQRSRDDS